MNNLHFVPVAESTGHAAQIFAAIKAAVGMVPNAYVGIGSNSPHALEAALNLDAALKKSSLTGREVEAVKLVVSDVANCEYCLAAHTMIGKMQGLDAAAISALRRGQATGDAKLDALSSFTRALVETRGTVPAGVLGNVRSAGYTDAQLVDVMLAVTSITFTNLFNRVNGTPLDFPPAG
ncbi:carboxymuconolactone decarboxylase family protein [Dyella sp. GSA-30]|uniref:carboxymuconolactone decarboxylase family protein n=1 Tax=Dyella sp. GSA-30 TaxID=2994496 RepID=UPI002492B844|nr:carboxymuconolactone decarboxylase family protein [Dyella sp. GSA-30]BDU23082.1 alkyl hydroperoxide reductase AhpD [Dyella sp. GSA-30]